MFLFCFFLRIYIYFFFYILVCTTINSSRYVLFVEQHFVFLFVGVFLVVFYYFSFFFFNFFSRLLKCTVLLFKKNISCSLVLLCLFVFL